MEFVKPRLDYAASKQTSKAEAESGTVSMLSCLHANKHSPVQPHAHEALDVNVWPLLVTTYRKQEAGGGAVRCPSQEYLELTHDFHHPAFVAGMTLGKLHSGSK